MGIHFQIKKKKKNCPRFAFKREGSDGDLNELAFEGRDPQR